MFFREQGQLSLQERGAIVALTNHGVSVREVAGMFNCHPTTVRRWMFRYEETLDVVRKHGSGRPRKSTQAEDAMLLDAVRAKPITTAQEIVGKPCLKVFCFFYYIFFPICRHNRH